MGTGSVQTDAVLLDVDRPGRTARAGVTLPILEVRGLVRRYGNLTALDGVDLAVMPGEFIALLGPSGSGKTTMLNLVAGLVTPTAGRILINGVDATAVPPSRRG